MNIQSLTLATTLVFGASPLLVGCHNPSEEQAVVDSPPTVSDWVRNYLASIPEGSLSDFEREVLEDNVITDDEYREAQDLFAQCMDERGWVVTFGPMYSTNVVAAPGNPAGQFPMPQEIYDNCQKGNLWHIQPLYLEMKYNPAGLNLTEQMRNCLKGRGLQLAEGMSDEQLTDLMDQVLVGSERVEPAEAVCLTDPTGIWGATEENVAEMWGWNH